MLRWCGRDAVNLNIWENFASLNRHSLNRFRAICFITARRTIGDINFMYEAAQESGAPVQVMYVKWFISWNRRKNRLYRHILRTRGFSYPLRSDTGTRRYRWISTVVKAFLRIVQECLSKSWRNIERALDVSHFLSKLYTGNACQHAPHAGNNVYWLNPYREWRFKSTKYFLSVEFNSEFYCVITVFPLELFLHI